MSLPVIEVVYNYTTSAFRANPTDAAHVKDAFDILNTRKGQIQKYFGLQHENKETGYVVIGWEQLEDHYALQNDKEVYPRLAQAVQGIFDFSHPVPQVMIHVRPTSEPFKAFEAPVTEIAFFTLLPGASKDELEHLLDGLAKGSNAGGKADGPIYASWGTVVEKDDMLVLFIGWKSVEAHHSAFKAKPEMGDVIAKAKTLANVDVCHVALTQG